MIVTITGKTQFDRHLNERGFSDDAIPTDIAFISICDTRGTDEVPYFAKQHNNVLTIFFDDVEQDIESEKYGKIEAFNYGQAKQIIHFVKANNCIKKWLIHCSAGISRSGAVGTFINDYLGGNYKEFKKRNPYIHPNGHVLALLNRVVRTESE